MSTPQDVVNWIAARERKFAYSQAGDRLHPDASGLTDCSALIVAAYREVMGLNIGTYTGNMLTKGAVVFDESMNSASQALELLLPGDGVFFNWSGHNPTYDHVECFAGGTSLWSHGGPGYGPNLVNFFSEWNSAYEIRAVRFATNNESMPSVPKPTANSFPAWPFPMNEYIGDIKGPNASHGGFYANEKPYIKLAQGKLWDLGYSQGLSHDDFVDGVFESPWSTNATADWQRAHMPGTEYYGQIWADDWAKLGSM